MPVIIIFCSSITLQLSQPELKTHLLVHHLAGVAHGCNTRWQLFDFVRGEFALAVVAKVILSHTSAVLRDPSSGAAKPEVNVRGLQL